MKEVKNLLNIRKLIERFTKTKNRMQETYKEITDDVVGKELYYCFVKDKFKVFGKAEIIRAETSKGFKGCINKKFTFIVGSSTEITLDSYYFHYTEEELIEAIKLML